jgi:hypothetical protein
MSKREEQRLAKLIKKNAGKASGTKKSDRAAQYDDTLRQKPEEPDAETKRFFKDMKRREF